MGWPATGTAVGSSGQAEAMAVGTEILFRGEQVKLEAGVNGESSMIRFGGEAVKVTSPRRGFTSGH